MRIRYENKIVVCNNALVKNREILFWTNSGELYTTNFPSNIDANEAFKLLFTQGCYVVSNLRYVDTLKEVSFIEYMLRED